MKNDFIKLLENVNKFFKKYDVICPDDSDYVIDKITYEEMGEDVLSIKFKRKEDL